MGPNKDEHYRAADWPAYKTALHLHGPSAMRWPAELSNILHHIYTTVPCSTHGVICSLHVTPLLARNFWISPNCVGNNSLIADGRHRDFYRDDQISSESFGLLTSKHESMGREGAGGSNSANRWSRVKQDHCCTTVEDLHSSCQRNWIYELVPFVVWN